MIGVSIMRRRFAFLILLHRQTIYAAQLATDVLRVGRLPKVQPLKTFSHICLAEGRATLPGK